MKKRHLALLCVLLLAAGTGALIWHPKTPLPRAWNPTSPLSLKDNGR